MKTSILIASLLCTSTLHAKTLTIGIDLSGSNPLLLDKNFANSAALYAANEVQQLKDGDRLNILSFGARSEAVNIKQQTFEISRRNRANKLAQNIGNHIQSIPQQMKKGQPSTNLVAWLEFTSGFDCVNESTILVITDGLESSSVVSAKDFMSGSKPLPAPDVDLTGCNVFFYGLGAGVEYTGTKNIRNGWKEYLEEAGATFTPIIP